MPDNCVRLWNIDLEPKVSRLNQAVLNKNLMVLLSGIEPPTSPLRRDNEISKKIYKSFVNMCYCQI